MITYEKFSENPKAFNDLSGVTLDAFNELYESFEPAWMAFEENRLHRADRRRAFGGGGQYRQDLRTHLLMSLIWLRLYLTTEAVGFLFGLHKSSISRNGRRIWQVLRQVSQSEFAWPELPKRGHGRTIEEAFRDYPDLLTMVGAMVGMTEKPLQRTQEDDIHHLLGAGLPQKSPKDERIVDDGGFDRHHQELPDRSQATSHKARRNHPLGDNVTNRLREAIIYGGFKPGQPLREEQLATMFQVSRGPVREALAQLERERLVQVRRHRGATVSWLSPSDVEEVYTLRLALERLAVQNAVVRATDRDFAALEQVIAAFDKALAEDPSEHEIARLDLEFHDIIYQAAHHQRLQDSWSNLRAQVYIFLLTRNIANPDFRDLTIGGHTGILNVLRSGDAEQAVLVIEEHLTAAYQRVVVDFVRHAKGETVASSL